MQEVNCRPYLGQIDPLLHSLSGKNDIAYTHTARLSIYAHSGQLTISKFGSTKHSTSNNVLLRRSSSYPIDIPHFLHWSAANGFLLGVTVSANTFTPVFSPPLPVLSIAGLLFSFATSPPARADGSGANAFRCGVNPALIGAFRALPGGMTAGGNEGGCMIASAGSLISSAPSVSRARFVPVSLGAGAEEKEVGIWDLSNTLTERRGWRFAALTGDVVVEVGMGAIGWAWTVGVGRVEATDDTGVDEVEAGRDTGAGGGAMADPGAGTGTMSPSVGFISNRFAAVFLAVSSLSFSACSARIVFSSLAIRRSSLPILTSALFLSTTAAVIWSVATSTSVSLD